MSELSERLESISRMSDELVTAICSEQMDKKISRLSVDEVRELVRYHGTKLGDIQAWCPTVYERDRDALDRLRTEFRNSNLPNNFPLRLSIILSGGTPERRASLAYSMAKLMIQNLVWKDTGMDLSEDKMKAAVRKNTFVSDRNKQNQYDGQPVIHWKNHTGKSLRQIDYDLNHSVFAMCTGCSRLNASPCVSVIPTYADPLLNIIDSGMDWRELLIDLRIAPAFVVRLEPEGGYTIIADKDVFNATNRDIEGRAVFVDYASLITDKPDMILDIMNRIYEQYYKLMKKQEL